MNGISVRSVGLSVLVLATASLALGEAHASKPSRAAIPLPTDWSHQHVIFSQPRTPEAAARVQRDVRYQQQMARHEAVRTLAVGKKHHLRGLRLHRDWTYNLGPGATAGAGRFPAKYSFSSTVAVCAAGPGQPDFIVYATNLPGSGTQGDIVAATNLYSGCPSGPKPANYWSYNTGGTVLTSPVLSLDGTQVAFTQATAGIASLVLLKWAAFDGFVNSPTTLTPTAASGYLACTAPCMTVLPLLGDDTNSSVYYDYATDAAFVGDDTGVLHQFTGVFLGTPTEVVTGGWPVVVNAGVILTSSVHDTSSGNTFVGDQAGFVHRIDSSGNVTTSGQLDVGTGLTEGPVLDSAAGSVYAFSSDDGVGGAGVFQLSSTFASGDSGNEAVVGNSSATVPLYNGAFDHNYIMSTTNTGNLYVCGNDVTIGEPAIYQVSIQSGVIGAVTEGPVISTTGGTICSPVTDVYNANLQVSQGLPQEWIYMSVHAAGVPSACTGFSCIMNLKVTSWQPNTTYNVGQEILDTNLHIQVVDHNGTSGATAPAWDGTQSSFFPTRDNTVRWRDQQGAVTAQTPPSWQPLNPYPGAFEILDANNNIEIAELPGGTSGGTPPVFPLAEGSETNDGSVIWYNLGLNPVAALQAVGGTSGIVIDNVANLPGASQVYFSTLGGGCGGLGTDGCAVQASQQGLN